MAGHTLDGNTIGLWRFREEERQSRWLYDAAPGARDLSFATVGAYNAGVTTARNAVGRCRFWGEGYGGATGPLDAALASLVASEWSVEVWIKIDRWVAINGHSVLFQAWGLRTDETSAHNCLGRFAVNNSTHKLSYFHEQGAGVDVAVNQAGGSALAVDTWYHVAITKSVSGGNATLKFYVDGVLIETSAAVANTNGGSSAYARVNHFFDGGAVSPTLAVEFCGSMKDMRLSSGVRSSADIAVSAAAADQKHFLDAATFALWRMEEEADALDASPSAMHLSFEHPEAATSEDEGFEFGGVREGMKGRLINGATVLSSLDTKSQIVNIPGTHPAFATYIASFNAAVTFEAWLKFMPDMVEVDDDRDEPGIFDFIACQSDMSAYNGLSLEFHPGRKLALVLHDNPGSETVVYTSAAILTTDFWRAPHHIALTKRDMGGGLARFEIYIDGVLLEESGSVTGYVTGETNCFFWIGASRWEARYRNYRGLIYEARLSNIRRSAAEIAASFAAGVPYLGGSSLTGTTPTSIVPIPARTADEEMLGKDIWFDVSTADGADYALTAAGDWMTVSGREALRQSLLRRFITNPGEWATLPGYGAGARSFVKARNSASMREQLKSRLREQALADKRVASVEAVTVEVTDTLVRISVTIIPKGDIKRNAPIVAALEVA